MGISPGTRDYRTLIAAASLIVGPLLMTIGDLFHPEERMDTAEQIAILMDNALRWYAAHLLLFIGLMLSIPGLLALTGLTAERKPAAGYAARILVLIGAAAFASIFLGEMLIGRFVMDGADTATATDLLDSMFSGPIVAAVIPGALAFFVGTAVATIPLMIAGGKLRWIAAFYSIGALLILAEIVSAQVILSKVGNALIFCGGAAAAWLILRHDTGSQMAS
jgi:hypothetical protein